MVPSVRNLYLLLFFATIVLFTNISAWGVTETSEARYAEISREMTVSGDYIHPTLLGISHYHKPPLTYWITAVAYHLFGPSAFSARFFLQLAVLLQLLLVYRIGIHLYADRQTAFWAVCIYFSFPELIIGARGLTTDLYLATTVLAAVYFWMIYRTYGKLSFMYLFYGALTAGFLLKGPVCFIVPVIAVIAYNRATPAPRKFGIHHVIAFLAFLVLSMSWFIALYIQDPDFFEYFVVEHTVNRFATNEFGRKQPFWFYLAIVPLTSFPWFFMLLTRIRAIGKKQISTTQFLLLWVLIPLVFFSLSTSKLVLYVLPIYPGIALLGAKLWKEEIQRGKGWMLAFILFSILIGGTLLILPLTDPGIVYAAWNYTLAGLITLFSLGLLYRVLRNRWQKSYLVYASVGLTSLLMIFATFFFQENSRKVHDQRNVAAFVDHLPGIQTIYVYNELMPSISFHLQREIVSIDDGDHKLDRETQFEQNDRWKQFLITPAQLEGRPIDEAVVILKENAKVSAPVQTYLNEFRHRHVVDGQVVFYN